MNDTKLPMRSGVGIILLNNENQVFVGKRKDNPGDKWQMPQGGVEDGEDFVTAMRRELYEETNIKNINSLSAKAKNNEPLINTVIVIIIKIKYRENCINFRNFLFFKYFKFIVLYIKIHGTNNSNLITAPSDL